MCHKDPEKNDLIVKGTLKRSALLTVQGKKKESLIV